MHSNQHETSGADHSNIPLIYEIGEMVITMTKTLVRLGRAVVGLKVFEK